MITEIKPKGFKILQFELKELKKRRKKKNQNVCGLAGDLRDGPCDAKALVPFPSI